MGGASKKSFRREEVVAYHEAGHAVIGLFLRYHPTLKGVTIIRTKENLGRCIYRRQSDFEPEVDTSGKTTQRVIDRIVGLLAGMYAAKRLTGKMRWVGTEGDRERACELAATMTGDAEETNLLLEWLMRKAENNVAARWPFIVLLAKELLKKKAMTGREIRMFLRSDEVLDAAAEIMEKKGA